MEHQGESNNGLRAGEAKEKMKQFFFNFCVKQKDGGEQGCRSITHCLAQPEQYLRGYNNMSSAH